MGKNTANLRMDNGYIHQMVLGFSVFWVSFFCAWNFHLFRIRLMWAKEFLMTFKWIAYKYNQDTHHSPSLSRLSFSFSSVDYYLFKKCVFLLLFNSFSEMVCYLCVHERLNWYKWARARACVYLCVRVFTCRRIYVVCANILQVNKWNHIFFIWNGYWLPIKKSSP